jgi:hypothetical protein
MCTGRMRLAQDGVWWWAVVNMVIITWTLCWILSIIWGIFHIHEVSGVGSTLVFRWFVIKPKLTLFSVISDNDRGRTRDLSNARLLSVVVEVEKLPKDGSRGIFRNVVYVKYTWDNG